MLGLLHCIPWWFHWSYSRLSKMKADTSQPQEHSPDCAEEILSKTPCLRDNLFPGVISCSLLLSGRESLGSYFWGQIMGREVSSKQPRSPKDVALFASTGAKWLGWHKMPSSHPGWAGIPPEPWSHSSQLPRSALSDAPIMTVCWFHPFPCRGPCGQTSSSAWANLLPWT